MSKKHLGFTILGRLRREMKEWKEEDEAVGR